MVYEEQTDNDLRLLLEFVALRELAVAVLGAELMVSMPPDCRHPPRVDSSFQAPPATFGVLDSLQNHRSSRNAATNVVQSSPDTLRVDTTLGFVRTSQNIVVCICIVVAALSPRWGGRDKRL